MLKKVFATLTATVLAASMLAGCTDNESASSGGSSESKDGKVTITTVRTLKDDTKFRDGEDLNNNPITRWSEKELGIKWETLWTVPNDEQYNNKIRLALSSGQKLPNVFKVSDGQLINDLIRSGKVMPVDEAIEKYASPRLKEIYEQFPEAFYPATVDGKRYGIPRFSGGNGSDSLLWIRKDWLDKLGLQPPKTIEDLEKIMDAFVNKDPDGNGKKDTIGLTLASKNGLATWLADGSFIFGAYGNYVPGSWSKGEDGSLVYGSVQPSMKKALEKLNEWYKKGYLDKEVGILDEQTAIESFVAGKSGIISAPPWAAGWPITDALKNNPGAVVEPYPLPSGPDGKIGRRGEGLVTGMFLFSKDFKHMDKFFEYLDAIYGYIYNDSTYFEYGLAEGYDYVMKDGKPVYDADEIPGGKIDPGKYFITEDIPTVPYMLYELAEELYTTKRDAKNAYEYTKIVSQGEPYMKAATIVNQQNQYRIENEFTGPPTKTMQKRSEFLTKMERETFANIIYGRAPLSAFDDFVKKWEESGGKEITKEVNEWYQSVKGEK
ncbi:extracellular solute-binding protein [Geobacillus stearothermophilus]|uniref:extracellular solute-binding protein n=1 Tax=Geobacillus zalihae TaxID=213419 RepID=UPI000763BDD4|nr:extracellular solute-binding protein [Geobacillus zalihae]QOR85902.1 extracellular solute-binding protein [Geobacillus stearothermophilus]WJP99035.1 extracellular solute-binding protein [Geobacillus stearothermophilus]WJQ02322.1 extracellular solute-binding protein [Geobacillus stearothermophilus]